MENEADNYQIIAQYLRDELSSADKQDFETRLEEDSDLRVQLKAEQITQVVLKEAADTHLKNEIRKEFKRLKEEGKVVQPLWNRGGFWFAIAAVISLFVLLSIPFFRDLIQPIDPIAEDTPGDSTEYYQAPDLAAHPDSLPKDEGVPPANQPELSDLFYKYFSSEKAILDKSRWEDEGIFQKFPTEQLRFEEAEHFIREGDQDLAIDSLSSIAFRLAGSTPDIVHYYLGLAYLSHERPALALENLEKTAETGLIGEYRSWLMSMAYLLQNDRSRADTELKRIVQKTGFPFKAEATEMLKEMAKI